MKNINVAEAMSALGVLSSHELTQIACEALGAGFDSDSMRMLAGLTNAQESEAEQLFEKSLRELGRPVLSQDGALRIYIRFISQEIINGDLSPEEGARDIWRTLIKCNVPGFHEGDPFIYAASEMQERPEDHEFFRQAIVDEARRWLMVQP